MITPSVPSIVNPEMLLMLPDVKVTGLLTYNGTGAEGMPFDNTSPTKLPVPLISSIDILFRLFGNPIVIEAPFKTYVQNDIPAILFVFR